MKNIIPFNLIESSAVVPVICSNCLDDIDIGDDCYIDPFNGLEEYQAQIYCIECVNNF